MPEDETRYLNTSLAKALRVLDLFNGASDGLSLTEIARGVGVLPGSVFPILYTLQRFGYLDRDPESKRYRLGLKILTQAHQILASLDVREQAKPILRRLAKDLGANAHLAILFEDEVLYLDREEAAPSMVIPSVIGRRVSPHCTALGKVLLAYNPEPAERVLSRGRLPAYTPHTVQEPATLRNELEQVEERGFAVDWEEFHEGNVCVAAPVQNYRGRVVAGISVSLMRGRLVREPLERFAHAVVEGAREVSASLGFDRGRSQQARGPSPRSSLRAHPAGGDSRSSRRRPAARVPLDTSEPEP